MTLDEFMIWLDQEAGHFEQCWRGENQADAIEFPLEMSGRDWLREFRETLPMPKN